MGLAFIVPISLATSPPGGSQQQVPTTNLDFLLNGTQPNSDSTEFEPFTPAYACSFCHGDYGLEIPPYDTWVVSLMAHAARDPVFQATLAIANADANESGSFCFRCHAPQAYLTGKGANGTMADFSDDDMGINCDLCHRSVNPVYGSGSAQGYPDEPPADPDLPIIESLTKAGVLPTSVGNAQLVIDPSSVRRGPYDDVPQNWHGVNLVYSPYHKTSAYCGECHDVGNPIFHKNSEGEFVLNKLGIEGPTNDVYQTPPEQRTYSEWLNSDFANGGVVFDDGRFGGSMPDDVPISSCQHCHMPDQTGGACGFWEQEPFFERNDVSAHSFAGGNTWVLSALRTQMGMDAEYYGLTEDRVDAANLRTQQMLRDASDMDLTYENGTLSVKITNRTGHKLPTGYPEGRRMWINVQFFSCDGSPITEAEYGAYNHTTSELDKDSTKVYEMKAGISDEVAKLTNLPPGESFHLVLNSVVLKDNRIPAQGFTNAAYQGFDGEPVGYSYADGDHWDFTEFSVPSSATRAVATLYHQTSSKEYIEFLRDNQPEPPPGQANPGDVIYDLWQTHGRSAPVVMDSMAIAVSNYVAADLNCDGFVNGADLGLLLSGWGTSGPGDLNNDGTVDGADMGLLLAAWTPA
ncbi:MAG: hypothetical protein MK085_06040 [Phycisphaerales bacterium]|nr:hypothetical protein [Phycisphaerales bacterium]